MDANSIIIKPLLSEKTYQDIQNKKYWFVVAKDATKTQIKKAVEELFSVKVKSVNTTNTAKKPVRRQGKLGHTQSIKKAAGTLTKDSKSIAFFDSLS